MGTKVGTGKTGKRGIPKVDKTQDYDFFIDEYVDEFLDIQKFYYDIFKSSGEIKEATEDRYIFSYLGGIGANLPNVTFDIKISKDSHYIEIEGTAPDVCTSK